jgi:hypothetical protein
MFGFLLDEGVVTLTVLSGLFTTSLLNSFKSNIVEPCIEKIVPYHKLDRNEEFTSLFPIPIGTNEHKNAPRDLIRWQTFLKDLSVWILLMFLLWLFWKFVLLPRKANKTPGV